MILPDIQSLTDIQLLRESVDLECKLALGRNGQGALPEDFWPTYSAFANTGGGVVVLGLRENNGAFSVEGVTNIAKVRTDLFNSLQNPQKISVNLLVDADVTELALPEGNLLVIRIPRADRKQRPVYLRGNPLGNTYIRRNEGDRRLLEEDVKRMLAEQLEDSRDDRILPGYGQADLCLETLRSYRQVFANRDPGHPWSTLDDESFLSRIGGWRQDRETGENGLTLAGLLMFGWMSSIQEALPNYMLDYQERPEAKIERRWMDRVTLDGKWSGNLYDFYRKVYLKLTEDLKVPFSLEQGERKDETPVHVALREALANVLVHADYSERASVLVVKRPDMFGFRNPGLMRIPPEIAIRGGEHDCRNRTLHKMFRFVGVGEQAGSGIPKIYDGWAEQHWRPPALYERIEPYNQTLLELRMVDLLPQALLADLRTLFGVKFDRLERNERLILAAAASEKTVTHARVMEMTTLHPVDATRLLQTLVRDGFLEGHNPGRGAVYCLPGAAIPKPEEVFGASSLHLDPSSLHLDPSSLHLPLVVDSNSPLEEEKNDKNQRDENGRLISEQLDMPVIDSLDLLAPTFRAQLESLAATPRGKKKISKAEMESIIIRLCTGHYVTGNCIAALVSRDPDALRLHYLRSLVQDGRLRFAFPTAPTHLMQAYCAA
ncbi:MAG TPA: RNA-binding domain-containing protein [Eoetvoesiella sp.]|jgi:predicted HTH transcriptional regulator|uniref:RNA-binding domain-containing protein n=1 Tax=Eoetvoesiella sp. TaxID=1966355 RepID=UPI002CA67C32|nr:RNA-binding domain-containing protein [Eoetvoesiella sp.]HWK61354.1 RNA-binding domain-containing protein [Eoetvoesiella sp.]